MDCHFPTTQQSHHFPPQLRKNLHILTTQTWILCRIKVEKQGENRTLWLAKKNMADQRNYCKWASEEFPGNHLKWRVPPLNQILIFDTNHIKSACIVLKYAFLLVLHHQQLNHTSHLQSPIKPSFLWGFKSLFLQLKIRIKISHPSCLQSIA